MKHIKNIFFIIALMTIAVEIQAQKGGATTQAENRNSGRSNTDKGGKPNTISIHNNGQTQDLSINMFAGQNLTGPVTAILYDKQGKENQVENALAFSSDGKKLNFNLSKFCHPNCPPEWKIAFISGSKREEFIIQNCNSWPPTVKKVVGKQN